MNETKKALMMLGGGFAFIFVAAVLAAAVWGQAGFLSVILAAIVLSGAAMGLAAFVALVRP